MGTATLPPPLTKKDFQTDQEVRWCRGAATTPFSPRSSRFPRAQALRKKISLSSPALAAPAASVLHEHLRIPHDSRPRPPQ